MMQKDIIIYRSKDPKKKSINRKEHKDLAKIAKVRLLRALCACSECFTVKLVISDNQF